MSSGRPAGVPGDLPTYGPAAADLDIAFGFALEAGILDPASVVELRHRRDVLLARLCALDPRSSRSTATRSRATRSLALRAR